MKNIIIFDTTLRDGEQSPGATMTVDQKIQIALLLEKMNVDIIEVGFAFASKNDFNAIEEVSRLIKNSTICSLARAREEDIDATNNSLKNAKRKRIHTFISTSKIQIENILKKTEDDVLSIIEKSVKYARNFCDDVEWSAIDASRTDIGYLIKCVKVAIKSGAKTINLPDTVGFCTPDEYKNIFEEIISNTDSNNIIFSTHCHDDLGLATSNALAGIYGGARQVECTINGIGERAGNTALEEIAMIMNTKNANYSTEINTKYIKKIYKIVEDFTFKIQPHKAIVGKNAFLHESGIHQDGVLKNKNTFEIINPEDIGIYDLEIPLGKLSGRSALANKLNKLKISYDSLFLDIVFEKFKNYSSNRRYITDSEIIKMVENI